MEEKKITENIDSSIYEDRKNEIIIFCISFMEALKSKELDSIVDKIEFPLEVECFIQKGKGKVIEREEFLSYYDSIFDNTFFIKIEEYANSLKKGSLVYDYQLGYDLRNEDFFTLGVNYVKKTDVIHDKYARIFRFEKRKGKYKLILIFCAG
ncbi:MAG: hypothetical protein LBV43_08345 [Prevotella sp.]|nr:hypothetical protein [Prevotella sp.]